MWDEADPGHQEEALQYFFRLPHCDQNPDEQPDGDANDEMTNKEDVHMNKK